MRRLKPYKIEDLYVEGTGYKIVILFDRGSKEFFVEFADKVIASGPLLEQVKQDAIAAVKAAGGFHWKRAIFAEFHSNKTHESNYSWGTDKGEHSIRIDCRFSRHEYSERPGDPRGNCVERPFGEEDTPIEKYKYFNPSSFKVEIPYSEEAWAGIVAIEEKFGGLCEKLFAMFHAENFEKTLKQISINLPLLLDIGTKEE